jgi:hypothetical protein
MHEPVFTDIDFEVDVEGRLGRLSIEDYVDTVGEPIRNKVTGEQSRAQIRLPEGFEYEVAEIGSGVSRSEGPVVVDYGDSYCQFANLHLSSNGVVRS